MTMDAKCSFLMQKGLYDTQFASIGNNLSNGEFFIALRYLYQKK